MTIDAQQAMNTVRAHLQNIETVEEGIIRGVKRYGSQPYALFYVDFSGRIGERALDLAQFQDRILGKHYFDNENDLRWNSYLFLLADKEQLASADLLEARTTLEGDRNYARKFVISEDELESRLESSSVGDETADIEEVSDAVGRWRQLLDNVGLADAFGETGIAAIVRNLVEKPTVASASVRRRAPAKDAINLAGKTIEHLEFVQFRRFPRIHEFDCGSVNLIRGVNGVGKTSFLEAIEFLFCGSTRRAGAPPGAHVRATIAGLKAPIETSAQTAHQVFRDRNLAWYGKRDVNRNNMVDSFAIYNFLNTDAAVDLSAGGDPVRVEADLATLLLGPEAARVWARIDQLTRDLPAERRSVERQYDSLQSQIKSERERLAAATNSAKTSDEVFAQLRADLLQLRWKKLPSSKEDVIQLVAGPLSAVESMWRRVMDMPDLPLERSMAEIERKRIQNVEWLNSTTRLLAEGSLLSKERSASNDNVAKFTTLRDEVGRAGKYHESRYPYSLSRERELRKEVADLVKRIGGLDPVVDFQSYQWPDTPMKALRDDVQGQVTEAAKHEATAKAAFDSFRIQKGQVESIHRDLRAAARQLLKLVPGQDRCPLCQSAFPPGELESHIFGMTATAEGNTELELSQAMAAARQALVHATNWLGVIEKLVLYTARWNLPDQLTSAAVVRHVESSIASLARNELDLREVVSNRAVLEKAGFNIAEWEALFRDLTIKLDASPDLEVLSVALKNCEEQLASERETGAVREKLIAELRDAAAVLRADAAPDVEGPLRKVQETITRRIDTLEFARAAFERLREVIDIDEATPLPPVLMALTAAVASGERLRLALQVESAAATSLNDAKATLARIEQAERVTAAALSRLRGAEQALDVLRSQHSREIISKDLLRACRVEVATIFSRIHSPREFLVSDSAVAPLERIDTGDPIELNKISSGQRAAFALSLFLALNIRAKAAPSILLIDDPVAHVDDLNTLSFLDYLRDLAAAGGRQIFFATADEKLAALFAHKFSFLGGRFKNHLFTRA